ncbi:MAG: TIGR01212 family radical SAM protein [Candidatus Omnitrophica bacterium]|nr:TIGR01212 family radical SAM protein [Candidatus Omnitrophota bacterium]
MDEYFYSFNRYLRDKFSQRVHRISLDAGFDCPNIDGTISNQGCIFCNNKAFSYFSRLSSLSLEEQIIQAKEYARKRFKVNKFIAYFQSNSNTYGDLDLLRKQYDLVRKFDDIVGIAISTRPDCIDEEKLNLIEDFAKDYEVYVEYGLQTIHDKTLKLINRGHTFADFQRAVKLTSARNSINIGVHVILGLPEETKPDMLATARILAKMPLWGIKFHVLHVVKGTLLADMHKKANLKLLSLDEYADILVSFLELLPKDRVILRLVSDAHRDLLVAPSWVNDKEKALKKINGEFKKRQTNQGALYESARCART